MSLYLLNQTIDSYKKVIDFLEKYKGKEVHFGELQVHDQFVINNETCFGVKDVLCDKFYYKDCSGCLINSVSNKGCDGTPWMEIYEYHQYYRNKCNNIITDELIQLYKNHLDFLENLFYRLSEENVCF